jgi:hypothetical protein
MKTFATATAAALIAFTGAASAMTAAVSGVDAANISRYAPSVDLSLVDADAVKKAANIIEELDEDDASFAQIQNGVRAALTKGL